MRSVFVGLCAIGLVGCATVSMVPGEATIQASLTEQQSALRASSDDFCTHAQDAGWVQRTNGIAGLARILMHGAGDGDDAASDYAERVGAETETPDSVFTQIVIDADEARSGLAQVAELAGSVLTGDVEYGRSDIFSFERSLVTAQKAHRNFARAADMAAARSDGAPVSVDTALGRLANEIDAARRVADRLADRYASADRAVS